MSSSKKNCLSCALSLIAVLLLAGCAKPTIRPSPSPATSLPPATSATPTIPATPSASPTGPYGDLRVGLSAMGTGQFDPVPAVGATAWNLCGPLYDTFLRIKGDQLTPGVVEKWEIAPDGLSWNLYIHKGIKFHNGDDLTAGDVKFSLDRYKSDEAFQLSMKNMIDRVDVVDDYTAKVITKDRQPYLGIQLSLVSNPFQAQVLPKNYSEKYGAKYLAQNPIGSGPFRFVRQVPGDMVEYQAVDKHWRQTSEFKRLILVLVPEQSTAEAMLKTGQLDVIETSSDSAATLEASGYKLVSLLPMQDMVILYGAYQPEAAKLPTADIRVRQALSLAINRDEIAKSFFQGRVTPRSVPFMTSPIQPDIDNAYWISYAAKTYRYDLTEAKKLLSDAGYPTGFSIGLWTHPRAGAPYLPKLAELIQGYWLQIGVKAQIVTTDESAFAKVQNILKSPTLIGKASTYKYTPSPVTPKNLNTGYHISGSFSMLGTSLPELQKLISDSYSETDAVRRRELLAKATEIGTNTYVSLPLVDHSALVALGPRVDIDLDITAKAVPMFAEFAKHKN